MSIEKVESKLDNLTTMVQDQSDEIAKITTVLGGSGMGDKGLIEQMSSLSQSHYKSKQEISKLKWFASLIAGAISTVTAGLVSWFGK